jgi:hypothetical protein
MEGFLFLSFRRCTAPFVLRFCVNMLRFALLRQENTGVAEAVVNGKDLE